MEGVTLKGLLVIPAMSAFFYNDILSLLSVSGCSLMFLAALFGSPLDRLGELGKWGRIPFVFGSFFQIVLVGINLDPEEIGFLFPMPTYVVNTLFAISFLLLAARGWLRRRQYLDAQGYY